MSNLTLYRSTTIGETLAQSLDEMVDQNTISKQLQEKVMREFDKQISQKLATVSTRMHFRGGLKSYRNCDNVWTLVLRDSNNFKINFTNF